MDLDHQQQSVLLLNIADVSSCNSDLSVLWNDWNTHCEAEKECSPEQVKWGEMWNPVGRRKGKL